MYDNEDSICGISFNCNAYYFIKNLQGDVIALAAANKTIVARYTYDAWGVCTVTDAEGNENTTSIFIGNVNPYRYRGYYYDVETGLYYLQSRYYNPSVGRFLNGDAIIDNRKTNTQNIFQYCYNNVINVNDPNGYLFSVSDCEYIFGLIVTEIKYICAINVMSLRSIIRNKLGISSNSPPMAIITMQEKKYAATVYAEAGGENKRSKQAVAHVMNNRIGTKKSWTDIEAVLSAKSQFNGYNSAMYHDAMNYYNTGICNNSIDRAAMNECLKVVIPIYSGLESDITGGALYFHSCKNPSDWEYHDDYTQIYVSGTEKFWFYK